MQKSNQNQGKYVLIVLYIASLRQKYLKVRRIEMAKLPIFLHPACPTILILQKTSWKIAKFNLHQIKNLTFI